MPRRLGLAMQPTAMLFDEPTSALDPELEAEVVRAIQALAKEGTTMIIVTHDMKLARDAANHLIFLHQGIIEEQGPPADVLDHPKLNATEVFKRNQSLDKKKVNHEKALISALAAGLFSPRTGRHGPRGHRSRLPHTTSSTIRRR